MKWAAILFTFVLTTFALAEELPLAKPCNEDLCKLPNCRCSSSNIPGDLEPRDAPQFVLLTFDDGVNIRNIETYREILTGRVNKNNCPASSTFFVNHEYTDYQRVNELYNSGHEIALHSITHQTPQTYWAEAKFEDMMKEFGDQKTQMAHFANIPINAIQGIRIPFLQMAGNATFQVMAATGLRYDSSWPTTSFVDPGLWPYTTDYASTQDCIIPPCPTASIPGTWVLPMISWTDLNGFPCSMADACVFVPPRDDEEAWFKFIVTNFERHYLGNRAPFGFYVHEWFISAYPGVKKALVKFLDMVNNLNDAFMVSASEVIDWVQDPVPVNEYVKKSCKRFIPTVCRPSSCGPLSAPHNEMSYWMQICNTCPRVYPWLGNPLGR
ncbi:chitin deacetylase 8-like [Battus philenor]|uniref:chitin deacetylase 8-like n=1 Tax=Battus philenor TaxID=42288 RepID=UPI0035D046D8